MKPPEITLNDIEEILSLTIKGDNANKLALFLAMLSAFTDDSQINVALNAPSSTGKTYLATEVAKLFPSDSIIQLSNATPTALFYGESTFDEERNAKTIDFERKILMFLEQPDSFLQANLRPLLSHDQKELVYHRTNRSSRGENRADKIIIKGFPATVFCSANSKLDEQETTRTLLLSPESSPLKVEQAVDQALLKSYDPKRYQERIDNDEKRNALKRRIVEIRDLRIDNIKISDPDMVRTAFQETVGTWQPRHTRDINKLLNLIKAIALLNPWHRQKDDGSYEANESDIKSGVELWRSVSEAQRFGINPFVLDFYKTYIVEPFSRLPSDKRACGISRIEISNCYLEHNGFNINGNYLIRQILPSLIKAGLLTEAKNPLDKRQYSYIPQITSEEMSKFIANTRREQIVAKIRHHK